MLKRALLLGVVLVGLSSLVAAQDKKTSGKVPVGEQKFLPGPPLEETLGKDKKEEPKENPRLQKLKQLSYDRRPSTMLKAWSTPLTKPKPKDSKDKAKAKETDEEKDKREKAEALDFEMQTLQRHVTLGNWETLKKYLAGLPEEENTAAYKQILSSLQSMPGPGGPGGMMPGMMHGPMPPQIMQFMEKHIFFPDDLLGLAAAAPKGLDKEAVRSLGGITRHVLAGGTVVEHLVSRFKKELAQPKDKAVLTARQAAKMLMAADQAVAMGEFLPTIEEATKEKDQEALNLLVGHFLALYAKEKKTVHLEKAWHVTQSALTLKSGEQEDKEESLRRAVELAPKIKEELGQAWLDASFTNEPERGMDILATIGGQVAQGITRAPMVPELRLKALQLQKTAVTALLKANSKRAEEWRTTLSLLAGAWLKEAEFSQQFAPAIGGQRMHRDRWGNIYFLHEEMYGPMMHQMQQPNMPRAIGLLEILETRPTDDWIALIEEGMKPKVATIYAHLFLKANEDEKAFPYIEKMAGTHKDKAKELVHEFLRVWVKNHDPNESRRYTNPYMFMYGFERRSESIPLTRSKQERNLTDLAELLKRLRKLDVGEIDEELVARAFTTCHSSAEVYRLDAIERVFGKLELLKPKTLAGLAQQMRENLAGLWRDPADQKDKKTNRKTKDIQAEVLRGYNVALTVIDSSLKKFPDDWSLHLARAALLHDEVNYHQELAKTSEFTKRRAEALAGFQTAAQLYAKAVPKLAEEDETTRVYEQWFYASLGASDLQHVSEEKLPDLRQPPLIHKAIQSLPGEAAERHMSKFANQLFTRLSSVKPASKYIYLKNGLTIVGEHKDAREAVKVFDYYKDLVTEIKLETIIDGSDAVGHQSAFGVFVNLRHTREIERESGGFGRYLQNQSSSSYFYYNYGRPTADYRDKFQSIVKDALGEHFEVISVTFQSDKVNSRALPEYGWRYTPYAYLLLKAKGPQVDKLPPVRLDLDFLETSGYVILPIESPTLPLDASVTKAEPRPLRKLQITQTLDERQADKGKLILEVKAVALGLIPALDQILELRPEGFVIDKTDDQGVSVAKFDPDAEQNVIVSERTWMVTLKAADGLDKLPTEFRFGAAKEDQAEMTYQRYRDADLVPVQQLLNLEERYGEASSNWLVWLIAGTAVLALVIAALAVYLLRKPAPSLGPRVALPAKLTPFTVLGLLKHIEATGKLSSPQKAEMDRDLSVLEKHFFADEKNGQVDLRALAERWVEKVN
ncbi:MAG: hypothetical protein L0Y72_15900 [Gemmataceae bacterium]|nr:hypothetical protein [Gemmataceae bacterium]MCI0740531.1 hypothetical protein [Gemmataceae bacterium]